MSSLNRRTFIKATAGSAFGAMTLGAHSSILGANEKVRFGIIGVGNKGTAHAKHLIGLDNAQLVALADPDPAYKMAALKDELAQREENPVQVDTYTDYRKLLDRKDIDAVIVVSCNHWHVLHSIHAIQAGKHVYVEKPISHNIWEGRQLVNLAKKSGLVVQPGLQHRSRHCWAEALDYIKQGNLGKVLCARGLCYKHRNSIGKLNTPATPPSTCNYDLWLGPAADEPIDRPRFHYDWHWKWNTGNADLGNQGVHQLDIARMMLGYDGYPDHVYSIGGRFGYEDAGQTPNTHIIFYDYKPLPILFEVRGLPMQPGLRAMPIYKNSRIGTIIECEGGYVSEAAAFDHNNKRIQKFTGGGAENHLPAFIKAIRNNQPLNLPCSIEDAHISTSLCHLGNISYRLGTEMSPASVAQKIKNDSLTTEMWRRFVEHLVINQVDLNKHQPTFGPQLTFDGQNETFTGQWAEKANPLLKREYRSPYTVPEIKA